MLLDTDMFVKDFIAQTPEDELPSIEWCRDNPDIVNAWPTLDNHPKGAAVYYGGAPR